MTTEERQKYADSLRETSARIGAIMADAFLDQSESPVACGCANAFVHGVDDVVGTAIYTISQKDASLCNDISKELKKFYRETGTAYPMKVELKRGFSCNAKVVDGEDIEWEKHGVEYDEDEGVMPSYANDAIRNVMDAEQEVSDFRIREITMKIFDNAAYIVCENKNGDYSEIELYQDVLQELADGPEHSSGPEMN